MTWLLGIFTSTIGRYLIAGGVAAVVALGFVVWHKVQYVPRETLNQWKDYATNLQVSVKKKEDLLRQTERERIQDNKTIEELEKEREKLYQEDRTRDNPVLLDRDDAKRLREFQRRTQ